MSMATGPAKTTTLNASNSSSSSQPAVAEDTHSRFDPYEHLKLYRSPDGTVTRLVNLPNIEANPDPSPGDLMASKDITLNPKTKTTARIFLPAAKLISKGSTTARLPIIIVFKGGAFVFNCASFNEPNRDCTQLTTEIPALVVSVNYRLAPENKIPAPYDDAVDALLWLNQQVLDRNGEPWLRDHGDFTKCYLYGRGSGANILFNGALRVLEMKLEHLKIAGMVFNQPMFGGRHRTESELRMATDNLLPLPVLDLAWDLVLPAGINKDHRYCNPMIDGPHKGKVGLLGRCLVIGFSGDPMFDRQQEFVEMLAMQKVRVEARFDEYGFHNIDLVDDRKAAVVINIIKDFMTI